MSSALVQSIRILLVDDHKIVCTGVRMLLESHPGLEVVGEAYCRADALAMAAQEQPDLIVLDLDLGGDMALDCIPNLLTVAAGTRILVLTGIHDPDLHRRAVCLGAMGLVLKDKAADVLLQAIEKVSAGEVWIERSMMAEVLNGLSRAGQAQEPNPEAAKIAKLTAREREVIALVGEGLRNQQIADRLYISATTVRHHLNAIFTKLKIPDRLALVMYAYRHELARFPG
jgi:two-component system, NarL family, nitrate/nitrite response regulator NarL